MHLSQKFADALAAVEASSAFLPFVRGEAARIERCAIAARRCFGTADTTAIDPFEVAVSIGVPVIAERGAFDSLPGPWRGEILGTRGKQWSAGTLDGPGGPLVVLNPCHARTRLKVTLAEELAHLVMGHAPSTLDPITGMRTHDSSVEEEAFGVGGALVLPYSQLFNLVERGVPEPIIAGQYALSRQLVTCRINRTGLRRMYEKRRVA